MGVAAINKESFVREWRAMVVYAKDHAIWSSRKTAWRDWGDFWNHLLGYDHWLYSLWTEEEASLVESVSDFMLEMLPIVIANQWEARSALAWLKTPASKPIRIRAISVMLPVIQSASEYWWRDEETAQLLSAVSNLAWQDDSARLTSNGDEAKHFRELVAILVARQDPVALDLQDRMATPPQK